LISGINQIKEEGIPVWDGYRKEGFLFKCDFFGSIADLLMKHEQLGHALSFSKLHRWCYRCWGNSEEALHIGTARTAEEHIKIIYQMDKITSGKHNFAYCNFFS
jgi:hypothetical protein